MERIYSTEIGAHKGERVRLAGWLHRYRRLANVSFLILRDAKGLAQVVISDPELEMLISSLQSESVLSVTGTVAEEAQAPGGIEIHNPTVEVLSAVTEPPPVEIFRPTPNAQPATLLDHAPVALRHPQTRALFQLSSASMHGFREALRARDFIEVQTPKIVASATEGGANVFKLDYFGRPAYLAQSPQFYKQMMVGVFERVFEVGPVFRAEPHDTPRHLNEYVSLDAEMGFINGPQTVMQTLTETVAGMVETMRAEAQEAVSLLGIALPDVPAQIPVIHFSEAREMITKATGENVLNEPDLAPSHERWLGEWAMREYGSEFLFVFGYPMIKRPFYTHPDPQRPEFSNSFDLLFRGLELVTGGQRLHLYEDYLAALSRAGLPYEPFAGYLEAFKHGMPPHGGFAIGLERWIARLVRAANIRETTLFPRDQTRLTP